MGKGKKTDSDSNHTDIPSDIESALERIVERLEMLFPEPDKADVEHGDNKAEIRELQAKTEQLLAEIAKRQADTDKRMADSTERQAEFEKRNAEWAERQAKLDKQMAETDRVLAENRKLMFDDGDEFEYITKRRAMSSIERILDEEFNAEFWGQKIDGSVREAGRLEVDACGGAREGVKTVYLVMIREKAKKRHIQELHDLVQTYRWYHPRLNNHRIYTMILAVKIRKKLRQKFWDAGIYLIEEVDGDFRLAKQPKRFRPNGNEKIIEVRSRKPFLHIVPGGMAEEGRQNLDE